MSSNSASSTIAKSIIFLVAFGLFLFLLYWLWQRQPKTELQKKVENKIETVQSALEPKDESNIDPPPGSVLSEKEIKIRGKSSPDSYIIVNSDSTQEITTSGPEGTFEVAFKPGNGLNQIEIIALAKKDLKETNRLSVEYYLKNDKEKLDSKSFVYSGPVKTIFDTLLSINTENGEKKIQTKKSTEFVFPDNEEEKSPTASALSGVRIGDFAIALGTIDKEKLMGAQKLAILRDNKPQINKKFAAVKILKDPRLNLVSAANLNDNKLIEITINKTTDITSNDKDGTAKDISKDKKAIVIFEKEGDKNLADLVYLLP